MAQQVHYLEFVRQDGDKTSWGLPEAGGPWEDFMRLRAAAYRMADWQKKHDQTEHVKLWKFYGRLGVLGGIVWAAAAILFRHG